MWISLMLLCTQIYKANTRNSRKNDSSNNNNTTNSCPYILFSIHSFRVFVHFGTYHLFYSVQQDLQSYCEKKNWNKKRSENCFPQHIIAWIIITMKANIYFILTWTLYTEYYTYGIRYWTVAICGMMKRPRIIYFLPVQSRIYLNDSINQTLVQAH